MSIGNAWEPRTRKGPTPGVPVRATVKLKAYQIVTEAVFQGIEAGWRHAYKHTNAPRPESIRDQIGTDVMNALVEVLDFE